MNSCYIGENPVKIKNVIPNNKVVMLLYAPWCGHCQAMEPEWEEVVKKAREVQDVEGYISKINIDNVGELNLSALNNVQGVPSIVLLKNGNVVKTYEKERKAAAILKWIMQHLRKEKSMNKSHPKSILKKTPNSHRLNTHRSNTHMSNTHHSKRPNTRKIKIKLGDEVIGEGDKHTSLKELTTDSLRNYFRKHHLSRNIISGGWRYSKQTKSKKSSKRKSNKKKTSKKGGAKKGQIGDPKQLTKDKIAQIIKQIQRKIKNQPHKDGFSYQVKLANQDLKRNLKVRLVSDEGGLSGFNNHKRLYANTAEFKQLYNQLHQALDAYNSFFSPSPQSPPAAVRRPLPPSSPRLNKKTTSKSSSSSASSSGDFKKLRRQAWTGKTKKLPPPPGKPASMSSSSASSSASFM